MNPTVQRIGRYGKRLACRLRLLPNNALDSGKIVGELIWNRLSEESHLKPLVEAMTDEQARIHFGEGELLETEHLRRVVRYFYAWRVYTLRQRIGRRLADAQILDVGDTDGLILKHLGKPGIGLNLSPATIRNIESNGIEARLGDSHTLPFKDHSFDYVFCFETLEHVENPYQVLMELARVCKPDGRVFVSIPWVPRTFIHPRNPDHPRGAMHIFEFCRDDFAALITHTPLRVVWEDICNVLGGPSTVAQRFFLYLHSNDHIVGSTFRRFQFFELAFTNKE
jgi:SAM-dependent methyltransferase